MRASPYKLIPMTLKASERRQPDADLLELDAAEILSEISIDEFHFKVTVHPWIDERCVLWFRDEREGREFEALGRFTHFDKRAVLFFAARYVTSQELRNEIDTRRFERQLDGMTHKFFDDIERHSRADKATAFRCLFNLDTEIDPQALARRRRLMARKFHPDAGGDHRTMSLINEAYEFLSQAATSGAQR